MSNRKDFTDRPIYVITDYIFWFLIANFYFFILNLPLVILLIGIQGTAGKDGGNILDYGPLLFLCCIPIGPAFTALLSTMGKLIREKDIKLTPTFFKAYKKNFWESVFYWCLIMFLIVVLHFDAEYFFVKTKIKAVPIIFQILQVFVLCLTFYIFPIITRFYFKIKDVLKLSVIYFFKKPYVTILSIFVIVALWLFTTKVTPFTTLFIMSLICYAIMYLENGMLKEIEEKIKPAENSDNGKEN